jgi:hypothetical protein
VTKTDLDRRTIEKRMLDPDSSKTGSYSGIVIALQIGVFGVAG